MSLNQILPSNHNDIDIYLLITSKHFSKKINLKRIKIKKLKKKYNLIKTKCQIY